MRPHEISNDNLLFAAKEFASEQVASEAALNCAQQLIARGFLDDAIRLSTELIQANLKCVTAYHLLAAAFDGKGNLPAAARTLVEALTIHPSGPAWSRLGTIYCRMADWKRAADAFETAMHHGTRSASILSGLFVALIGLQKVDEACIVRDALLEAFPDEVQTHVVVGHLHKIFGRRHDAIAAYRRVLKSDETHGEALFNLSELDPSYFDEQVIRKLRHVLAGTLGLASRVNVAFALARAMDSSGRYDAAFADLEQGNNAAVEMMRRNGIEYQREKLEQQTERTISTYSSSGSRSQIEYLPFNLQMIFIVGMPRSGTTLVEQILASHREVAAGGEVPLMQVLRAQFEEQRERLGIKGPVDPSNPIESDLLMEYRERYVDDLFERDMDGMYITDKLPANFNALGFIRMMFPDSVIVHCDRNPVATCWSLYSANLGLHHPYCGSFENLAHYYGLYRRLMAHWRTVLRIPMIEVTYELLVAKPEECIRSLISGCGLLWDENCLAFHQSASAVLTASQLQVRKPVYQDALDRWRNYEKHLGPLLRNLRVSGVA